MGRWANPADRAIEFIETLTLSDDFAGKPFKLAPWQVQIIRQLFGTLTPEGLRQYRTCLLFIPRKNGKSQLVAAISIYWLLGMGKREQEIILGTTSVDQSRILYKKIISTIRANKHLSKLIEERKATREILVPKTGNSLKIISNKGDMGQGFNPSLAIIDELHTLPDRKLYKALTTGRGSRREPLTLLMTTAGNDRSSLCYEEYLYACKVRDGVAEDPSYLPIIYETPKDADIYDPEVWKLSNPGIGSGMKSLASMVSLAAKAKVMPSAEMELRQYELNQWVASEHKWMNMDLWDACGKVPINPADLRSVYLRVRDAESQEEAREPDKRKRKVIDPDDYQRYPCFVGFDLSESRDVTALVAVFDMGDGTYHVLPKFWIPEDAAREYDRNGFTQYGLWAEQGHISLMPGGFIDFDQVERDIIELYDLYDFQTCYFDSWHARRSALKLIDAGFPMESYDQTFRAMAEPTAYLQWLIGNGKLEHGNNPVLTYMANNAVAEKDRAGNTKVTKGKEGEKVDGIVCLVMAIAAATLGAPPPPEPGMVYVDLNAPQQT